MGRRVAEEMGVPFLGSIPMDPEIAESSDCGTPFVLRHPDSASSKAFSEVVSQIKKFVEGEKLTTQNS